LQCLSNGSTSQDTHKHMVTTCHVQWTPGWLIDWGFTSHSTQNESFWRLSSQPSSWLGTEGTSSWLACWTVCVGTTSGGYWSHARDGERNADCSRSDFSSAWRTRTVHTDCQEVRKLDDCFLLPLPQVGRGNVSTCICLFVTGHAHITGYIMPKSCFLDHPPTLCNIFTPKII